MKHSFYATISVLDAAIVRRSFDAPISALGAETSVLGAATLAIARSYRRLRSWYNSADV